jgi:uncharacterized membrane protein YedE/YeeE
VKAPRAATILLAGALFGLGLAVSGMTDPRRVIGFLDVTGAWDPTLAFVMAGAVGTYGLGRLLLPHPIKCRMPAKGDDTIDRRLLIGAAIFGIGWGLSGFCPGPALANLGGLHREACIFVPMMVLGMLAARRWGGAV